ncbi:unnamed protein product [Pylaiella littoralis]
MWAANSPVCNEAFTQLFGVSETSISAAKKTKGALASSCLGRTPLAAAPPTLKADGIAAWLEQWAESFGQAMPNSSDICLYAASKKELYEYYVEDMRVLHRDDPSALNEALAGSDYFNKVWKERFPKLKIKTRGDFMVCGTCTRLKDVLHGQAGVRGAQGDDRVVGVKEKYKAHLKDIKADRAVIARCKSLALSAKANGKPYKFMYKGLDAADQSNFSTPHMYPMTHGGDKGYLERQKIYAVHTTGQSVSVFFTPQFLGTGSNLVCTALYLELMQTVERYNEPIEELVIQVDNTLQPRTRTTSLWDSWVC